LQGPAPSLLGAAAAIGAGLLAHVFLRAEADYCSSRSAPDFFVITIAGLAAALGLIAATLPLRDRITRPDNACTE
jgi:hypothetical protein